MDSPVRRKAHADFRKRSRQTCFAEVTPPSHSANGLWPTSPKNGNLIVAWRAGMAPGRCQVHKG